MNLIRHVIVEGPDGAGKTRLVESIHTTLGVPIHAKASNSQTGPVADLAGWVMNDRRTIHTSKRCVYDRHPLISEPIYGKVVRSGQYAPKFDDRAWMSDQRLALYPHVYVIWCLPPAETLRASVSDQRDMPGVALNIARLRVEYARAEHQWGGLCDVYDFTTTSAEEMIKTLRFRIDIDTDWKRNG